MKDSLSPSITKRSGRRRLRNQTTKHIINANGLAMKKVSTSFILCIVGSSITRSHAASSSLLQTHSAELAVSLASFRITTPEEEQEQSDRDSRVIQQLRDSRDATIAHGLEDDQFVVANKHNNNRRRLQDLDIFEEVPIRNSVTKSSTAAVAATIITSENFDGTSEDDNGIAVVSVTFEDILLLTLFIAAAWIMSNVSVALGLPGLVGEIICGFLLGPPLADMCPFPQAMVLIGNFGLLGLMLESGIHLDIAQLRETGTRAVLMATTGALLALGSGLALGYNPIASEERNFATAMAVGSSFAPSSLGVAAAVLSSGQVLNTPIGQLIVASSVVDDVLGLILLAILNVFVMDGEPTAWNYIQPFLASFGFLGVLGYSGITWIPHFIQFSILPRFRPPNREKATFAIMFLLMLIYLPLLNYAGASYLTGAFLAGLSVSQLPSIHLSYEKNGRELMVWLMRIFFTATIGFQVPILEYDDLQILKWAAIFLIPIVAKLPLGLLVPRFHRTEKGIHAATDFPFNPFWRDALITSLSVMCRGEFNFVVASFGLSSGLLTSDVYSAIVLAVLLSSILGPLILSRVIQHYNKLAQSYLSAPHTINRVNKKSKDGYRPLFIAIQIRTPTSWGLHERFQHTLEDLGLLVLDHRTWHTNSIQSVAMSEIFVQDTIQAVKISNCFSDDSDTEKDYEKDDSTDSIVTSGGAPSSLPPSPARTSASLDDLHDVEEGMILSSDGEVKKLKRVDSSSSLLSVSGTKICSSNAAIQRRLDGVKDALEAVLEGVDENSYAIQTTQWEPFIQEVVTGHRRQRTYTFGDNNDGPLEGPAGEELAGEEPVETTTMLDNSQFLNELFGGTSDLEDGSAIFSIFTSNSNVVDGPIEGDTGNVGHSDDSSIDATKKKDAPPQLRQPNLDHQYPLMQEPKTPDQSSKQNTEVASPVGELPILPRPSILRKRAVSFTSSVPSSMSRRSSGSSDVASKTPPIPSSKFPPRPPTLKTRAATVGHQPQQRTPNTNNSPASSAFHRRTPSNCEGRLESDLWERDAIAHKCVRPGTCIFQPTVSGHKPENSLVDEQLIALANQDTSDYHLSDDEGEEIGFVSEGYGVTSPAASATQTPSGTRRRHASFDFNEEQETQAIHNFLHGYIRH